MLLGGGGGGGGGEYTSLLLYIYVLRFSRHLAKPYSFLLIGCRPWRSPLIYVTDKSPKASCLPSPLGFSSTFGCKPEVSYTMQKGGEHGLCYQ